MLYDRYVIDKMYHSKFSDTCISTYLIALVPNGKRPENYDL